MRVKFRTVLFALGAVFGVLTLGLGFKIQAWERTWRDFQLLCQGKETTELARVEFKSPDRTIILTNKTDLDEFKTLMRAPEASWNSLKLRNAKRYEVYITLTNRVTIQTVCSITDSLLLTYEYNFQSWYLTQEPKPILKRVPEEQSRHILELLLK
jgi:hypothetical protein